MHEKSIPLGPAELPPDLEMRARRSARSTDIPARPRFRSPLPGGTVTFLFTDIEGSTRLLRRIGDRYAGVLERHRELLRGAMASHGGAEVDCEGDGLFFALGGPSRLSLRASQDSVPCSPSLGPPTWLSVSAWGCTPVRQPR